MTSPYATDKLRSHPMALHQLRTVGTCLAPITVHLMPQNVCNQSCSFCSYRLPDNKNSSSFNESAHIPLPALQSLLADFYYMGVKGIEVTGGGEPLAYPHTRELWQQLSLYDFHTALVSNGTLLHKHDISSITENLKWARISIDAATPSTYATMRKAPPSHFDRAWQAVSALREHMPDDPDFRLGVGFVLSNENLEEVYDFVARASTSGADNVRLSSTFSDKHLDYFSDHSALTHAANESRRAVEDFDSPEFRVHNLIPVRLWETEHPTQDYRRCPTKDVLCVVEGECKVYTCCTFTGSLHGLYGRFDTHPQGFKGLWAQAANWRKDWDCREACQCACLYRERNLAMNSLIDSPDLPPYQEHLHDSFI